MTGKDIIMARKFELKRLYVINQVIEKKIKRTKACELLLLGYRQVGRIIKRVKEKGDAGIIHQSRGKPSNRGFTKKLKDTVIKLYRAKYNDFSPTLFSEKLFEIDKIKINHETLRLWLIESGDWKRIRKNRTHREWRERKPCFGEMIQIDGSHHAWFEDRGPWSVYMGYIDDATSKVFGRFYGYEGTLPFMDSFKCYIRKNGIPLSVYIDKHSTYKSAAKPSIEDELNGIEPMSQVERALNELGVDVIHANSPQAKGRIERSFRTKQNRLIKEMRLKQINSAEEANKFLPEYLSKHNKKFAVKPREKANMHRPVPKGLNLDKILCIKTERVLKNDFTISYEGKLYQIKDKINAKKVMVEIRTNGSMFVTYSGANLKYKEIAVKPLKENKRPSEPAVPRKYVPAADHPWKKFQIGKKANNGTSSRKAA
ncbi:MAG: ISNCY family transposase [Armatimonadota bacterium]